MYALGSAGADHGVPGVAEHAYNVAGKQAALRLRARLSEVKPGGTVLIVGGGLTGIEAATEIAEAHPDLEVAIAARGRVGGWLSDKAQRHLRGALDRSASRFTTMPTSRASKRTAARIKEMICASAAWSVSHPTMMLPSRRHLAVTGAVDTRRPLKRS
ncbi:hypothetical protein Mro03_21700 [Microbispora rosea subsp. rosea]|nr:hypothetical protein Mro03_21700 [Microbispora rosea subsp. rosea]